MNTLRTGIHFQDADEETQMAARVITRSLPQFLETMDMVSAIYLGQVLLALWDNGFYEYMRKSSRVEVAVVASELELDATVLQCLIDYLVGRGLLKPEGTGYVLTEKGRPYWNYVTRGVLTANIGGYNPLLTRLGPLLRKEIDLGDPSLDRIGRLVGVGANYTLLGSGTVEWVLDVIQHLGGKYVMDLGCGGGAFLIQLARRWPQGGGVGIDLSKDSIAEARKAAAACNAADRVAFYQARLSPEPLDIAADVLAHVDTITALYVLHEFGGRGGPPAIAAVLSSLRKQFPGRKLLMAEGTRADPVQTGAVPPRNFGQLDYSFFHPLSRQGPLHTPDEWQAIIQDAGATLIERIPGFKLVPAWMSLYVIGL